MVQRTINSTFETNFHRSHVSNEWCISSDVLVLTIEVMVNQIQRMTIRTTCREASRSNRRSNNSMPRIVGTATMTAQGNAVVLQVYDCGFKKATMIHRTMP